MQHLRKTAAAVIAAILAVATVSTYASSDITIKMNGLSGKTAEIIHFEDNEPIQYNSVTLAGARTLAEAAGMEIAWNQSLQTANIKINANSASDKPIEIYGAKVIGKVDSYGLELAPESITASLKLNENIAALRYNFKDTDGDVIAIGKTVELAGTPVLVDDKALMVPVRSLMEMFGLDVMWDQDDLSMKISIPDDENITIPNGLKIIANADDANSAPSGGIVSQTVGKDDPVNTDPSLGEYIGRFKITHYAPGAADNGKWGNATAWAGEIVPGRTIAVDPKVIPKLSWVYIDGYGLRRAEDCGGAVKGNVIDVAVSSKSEARRLGVVYKDVYRAE